MSLVTGSAGLLDLLYVSINRGNEIIGIDNHNIIMII